ncbi:MAG: hypothetical protein JWO18_106 [Microbacteriaceae bacterium]|nr:hypothetical protein [Microbacteriaceae bacterium]
MIIRVLGMAVSWIGFSLAFTLVFLSMRAVLAVGGFCADGGPYVIAVHCPPGVDGFLPIGIYLGLASVAVAMFLARGFGASLILWAWPILFVGLGYNFLDEGFGAGFDPIGLGLGAVFVVMGIAPLLFWLRVRGNLRAMFVGNITLRNENIGDVGFGRLSSGRASTVLGRTGLPYAGDSTMGATDYAVLVVAWLVEVALGVWLGALWFFA